MLLAIKMPPECTQIFLTQLALRKARVVRLYSAKLGHFSKQQHTISFVYVFLQLKSVYFYKRDS